MKIVNSQQSLWSLGMLVALLGILMLVAGCASNNGPRLSHDKYFEDVPGTDSKQEPNAKTMFAMARILESQDKYPQAELVYLNLLDRYPQFSPAYANLAELMVNQGRTEDAKRTLEKGIVQAPNDPILHNNLGMCHLMQNNYEAALHHFEAAVTSAPYEAKYYANKGLALGMLGRNDEALAVYRRVMTAEDAEHNLRLVGEVRERQTD